MAQIVKAGIFIFLVALAARTNAQSKYTKIHDNPDEAIKGFLAVEFFGIDFGSKNMAGTMFYTVGANALYPITDRIKAEGYVRIPLLRAEKTSPGLIVEGGGNLLLGSSSRTKNVNILLGYKEERSVYTVTRQTKFVNMPVTVKKTLVARGGLYFKKTPFEYKSDDDFTTYKMSSIFHKGIYLGLGRSSQYLTHLETVAQNGKSLKFAAGSYFMPFADILVLPVSNQAEVETYGLGPGAITELEGKLGWRAGFKWIRNPFTGKQNFNRGLSFMGNMVVGLEAGQRPLEGFYLSSTVSYAFKKFN